MLADAQWLMQPCVPPNPGLIQSRQGWVQTGTDAQWLMQPCRCKLAAMILLTCGAGQGHGQKSPNAGDMHRVP